MAAARQAGLAPRVLFPDERTALANIASLAVARVEALRAPAPAPKVDRAEEEVKRRRQVEVLLTAEREFSAAVHLFPTQVSELIAVSDAGLLMPPKSTWFEPKLKSGLFVHTF